MDMSCKEFHFESLSNISCRVVAHYGRTDFASMIQLERLPAQKLMIEGAIKLKDATISPWNAQTHGFHPGECCEGYFRDVEGREGLQSHGFPCLWDRRMTFN